MIDGIFSNSFHTHHFYRLFCVDETNQKETQGSCVLVTLACTVCVLSLDSGKVEMDAFNCGFIHLPASVRLGFGTQNVPIRMDVCVFVCTRLGVRAYKAYQSNVLGFGFFSSSGCKRTQHIWVMNSNWFLQLKNCFCNRRRRMCVIWAMKYDAHGVVRF